MTFSDIAAVVFGLVAIVFGIMWWRAAKRGGGSELGETALGLATKDLEREKREAARAIEEARNRISERAEERIHKVEEEANRDKPDLDIHGRPRS